MRAERSRGWRIRSQSWRNELIETDIRQKARQCRAFSFRVRAVAGPKFFRSVFLLGAILPHLKHRLQKTLRRRTIAMFEITVAATRHASDFSLEH
jgi:hypothetical protein